MRHAVLVAVLLASGCTVAVTSVVREGQGDIYVIRARTATASGETVATNQAEEARKFCAGMSARAVAVDEVATAEFRFRCEKWAPQRIAS